MTSSDTARRPRVVVGVAGGIAAFKGLEVIRLLAERGCEVTAVPTLAALRFVGEASFTALSGRPARTDIWADVEDAPHVAIGRGADLVLVVPATADLMAKAATGLASDLLTATLLTATCPVVMAPAMHTEMWEHAATAANVATLRSRGVVVLEPAVGRLTGVDSGKGRLPDPTEIVTAAMSALRGGGRADLAGRSVVVTAGGTREPLDPVRFLGNRSSGRMGYALAATAAARGARVTLISANVSLPTPAGVDLVRVGTALELEAAVSAVTPTADAVVMAAAVADFRPASVAGAKLKKSAGVPASIELVENPDILRGLVERRPAGQLVVGFAAETGDESGSVLEHGRAKLAAKGCDLLVVNEVGEGKGFEVELNSGWVLSAGAEVEVPLASKEEFAETVWDLVTKSWPRA